MKPENIFLLAIVGLGLWYLSRQPAAAATVKFPVTASGALDTANATFAEIVAYRKAQQAGLRTAQTGTF